MKLIVVFYCDSDVIIYTENEFNEISENWDEEDWLKNKIYEFKIADKTKIKLGDEAIDFFDLQVISG